MLTLTIDLLPPQRVPVLALYESRTWVIASIVQTGRSWHWHTFWGSAPQSSMTHWQYLPELPKVTE